MKKVVKTSVAIIATFAISACQTTLDQMDPEKRAALNYRGHLKLSDNADEHCKTRVQSYYTNELSKGKTAQQAHAATNRFVSLAYVQMNKNVHECQRNLAKIGLGTNLLDRLLKLSSK